MSDIKLKWERLCWAGIHQVSSPGAKEEADKALKRAVSQCGSKISVGDIQKLFSISATETSFTFFFAKKKDLIVTKCSCMKLTFR